MKAKKKKIDQMSLADLGIDAAAGAVTLEKLEPVPERSGAKMIEGSVEEQVTELIRVLKEDEKVL
jgi:electron transfer flavoprotein beta subunit